MKPLTLIQIAMLIAMGVRGPGSVANLTAQPISYRSLREDVNLRHSVTGRKSPALAPIPAKPERMARCDLLVINRVRHVSISYDERGREHRNYSETVWASFWEWLPLYPPAGLLIDRGWHLFDASRLSRCSEGWAYRSPGVVIVATELRLISSDHDWEVRHREIYLPFR